MTKNIKTISTLAWYGYGFLKKKVLWPNERRTFHITWSNMVSQVITDGLELKNILKSDNKIEKTISTLAWYRYGFLKFLPFRLYQYKIFHFNRLDHVPCLLLSSLIQSYFSFQEEELKEKKSEKPYLYRPGVDMVFCKFYFKHFWTYMLRHICVNYMNFLPEVLFKTTKKAKNHIYTSSV